MTLRQAIEKSNEAIRTVFIDYTGDWSQCLDDVRQIMGDEQNTLHFIEDDGRLSIAGDFDDGRHFMVVARCQP